eukprot:GGOE01044447.1.p1 GENE.GGOE01044447.1~~GGOE01044447.1.p1  ORF type:complete len:549 (-),score=112.85 GGOE01044447.1:411-2057(-)
MAGFAEPIHTAALHDTHVHDGGGPPDQKRTITHLDVVPPDVAPPDQRSVHRFWRRPTYTIALTCLAQLALSLATLVLTITHLTRVHSHPTPVTVLLADQYALTALHGGWIPWQGVFRLVASATLSGLNAVAIAALLAGLKCLQHPVALLWGPRCLLTLNFIAMTGLFAYFTIFDAYSVAITARSSSSSVSGGALPDVTCCSVQMNRTWVERALSSAGKCYDGTGSGCASGNSTGTVALTSPAQLVNFTCAHVLCAQDEFIAVCVLDGFLFLACALGVYVMLFWWRRRAICEHCGSTPHHCLDQLSDPCVFCGQQLHEGDWDAHMRRCWEEQTRLQLQLENRMMAATEAAADTKMTSPSGVARALIDPQPVLRGGCLQPSTSQPADAYAVEDEQAYLESQNLLATTAAAPPIPLRPPEVVPSAATVALPPHGASSGSLCQGNSCQYCFRELGPTPMAEHLNYQCTHYLVPCRHCSHALPYKDRNSHERCCPMKPCRCRFCDCSLQAELVAQHERHECQWRTVKCSMCACAMCYRDWQSHTSSCQQAPRR